MLLFFVLVLRFVQSSAIPIILFYSTTETSTSLVVIKSDQAHDMLCLEVEKLRENRRRLLAKIDESKSNFNLLEEHGKRIDTDLENKQHSLMTDIRALDLRMSLKGGEFGTKVTNPSQTDGNITLTRMEYEIPKD